MAVIRLHIRCTPTAPPPLPRSSPHLHRILPPGWTEPPLLLRESDLLDAMDKNGIGTVRTMLTSNV